MRTTITIDRELLAKLKKRSAAAGTSVSRLVEQAARLLVEAPAPTRRGEKFKLVTFGAKGRFSRFNIDKTSTIFEAEDVERFTRRR